MVHISGEQLGMLRLAGADDTPARNIVVLICDGKITLAIRGCGRRHGLDVKRQLLATIHFENLFLQGISVEIGEGPLALGEQRLGLLVGERGDLPVHKSLCIHVRHQLDKLLSFRAFLIVGEFISIVLRVVIHGTRLCVNQVGKGTHRIGYVPVRQERRDGRILFLHCTHGRQQLVYGLGSLFDTCLF